MKDLGTSAEAAPERKTALKKEIPAPIEIRFGALSLPLAKQLHGRNLSNDVVECIQRDADAVTRLLIRGFIPESLARKARQRIMKDISKEVLAAHKAKTRGAK